MRLLRGAMIPAVVAGLALGALPGLAEARDYTVVKTPGFTAKLPATLKLATHRKFGPEVDLGRWVYESSTKKLVFRIRIERDTGGDFKKLASEFFGKFQRRVDDIQMLKDEFHKEDARDVHIQLFKATMPKGGFMKEFLFFRLFTRTTTTKKLVAVSVAAVDETQEELEAMVNTIVDSLELGKAQPIPGLHEVPGSIDKAKKGGKP